MQDIKSFIANLETISGLHIHYITGNINQKLFYINTEYPAVLQSYTYNAFRASSILLHLNKGKICHFKNALGIEDFFIPLGTDSFLCIGPYSTKYYSPTEANILLEEHGIHDTPALQYFYSFQLPIISDTKIDAITNALLGFLHFSSDTEIHHIVEAGKPMAISILENNFLSDNSKILLLNEKQSELLNAVGKGDYEKCLQLFSDNAHLNHTHQYFSDPVKNEQINTVHNSSLICHTAKQYVLNPIEIDKLHNEWIHTILKQNSISNIRTTNLIFLKNICHLVEAQHFTHYSEPVQRVLSYLLLNTGTPLDIENLCKYMKLSRYQLEKQFQLECGISISKYHLNLRLEKAKQLLITTTLPINEIASQTAFADQNYFTKVFKKTFGTTPSIYRYENR